MRAQCRANTTQPMPTPLAVPSLLPCSGLALQREPMQGHELGKRMKIISSYIPAPQMLHSTQSQSPWKWLGAGEWEERQILEFQGNDTGNMGLGSHLLMWRKRPTVREPEVSPLLGVICTSPGYHHLYSPWLQGVDSSLRIPSQKILIQQEHQQG